MLTQNKPNKSSGLTLVEVLVVAPIVVLVIGIFIGMIIYLTGDVISTRVDNSQSYMIQDALDRIEQDVKLSTSYLATNNIAIQPPQGYDDISAPFDNASANGNMLILNMYAISKSPTDQTRSILYIINTPNSCTSGLVDQNTPLFFNIVYFVKDNKLVRRVIAESGFATNSCDPSTQLVAVPWQAPSCSTATLIANNPEICKTLDEVLVTGVSDTTGFITKYYAAGSIIEIADAVNTGNSDTLRQTALDTADMVNVTIDSTVTAAGRDINQSGTMRATKYNTTN